MILGRGNTQFVEDLDAIAEHDLAINMTKEEKKFVLSLHYVDGGTSFMYVNGILMVNFTSKPSTKQKITLASILVISVMILMQKKKLRQDCMVVFMNFLLIISLLIEIM